MRKATIRSINHPSRHLTLWLLAAAIGLCPSVASAGSLGHADTATGTDALINENGGDNNTADGYEALYANYLGYYNTAVGYQALANNTQAYYNVATGATALHFNTIGGLNTASGTSALYSNTTGGYNTASGTNALYSNVTGNDNAATGVGALYTNDTGSYNVAVGVNALHALAGSSNSNIALGFKAGERTTSGSSNIYIGHPGFSGSESNAIRIGNGQSKTFVAGIVGVPLSGATVVVNSKGQLGVVASSARYKTDIEPLAGASDDVADKLAQLRPVSYRYKTEPEATHYGLVAEEVEKVMPELVVRNDQNRPESVQYQELIPLLLQEWKVQQAENARQRELIAQQQAELAELRRTLTARLATLDEGRRGSEARFK